MNPILVPTLSELGVELQRAMAIEAAAHQAWRALYDAGNHSNDLPELDAVERAGEAIYDIIEQIAAMPAASLADLRVKAIAMDWHNRMVETPEAFWEKLGAELVAGLLDERLAR